MSGKHPAARAQSAVKAIDVHAHIGNYAGAKFPLSDEFSSGGPEVVLERARRANTELSIVSPLRALLPRGEGDPESANRWARRMVSMHARLRQWVVVDPRKPRTFDQAAEMLAEPQCAGIKIHPWCHRYAIKTYGRRIFQFAEKHGAVVQSHSGDRNCQPMDFVPFANAFPGARLILSHLGNSWDQDPSHQVRAIQAARHGNIYTDTSSSKSITSRLHEWAVKEVGAEKILFGTDSPLYFAPMQRARVDHAALTARQKQLILRENAVRLFGLKLK